MTYKYLSYNKNYSGVGSKLKVGGWGGGGGGGLD